MASRLFPNFTGRLATTINLFRERRLPWRVSQWMSRQHQEVLRRYYDWKINATRPFRTGEECPNFELHMLLGRKHVGMCLWAVKSFLNAAGRAFTVVLHDDGTLTTRDIRKLESHLIGSRVVKRSEADALLRETLRHYPNCLQYRFTAKSTSDHRGSKYNMRIFSLRLFDFNLLSGGNKTLVLDADVLFFRAPSEIIRWATSPGNGVSLYSVEQYLPVRDQHNRLTGFEKKHPTPTAANAGLLCFDKQAFDLPAIEKWIGEHQELMDRYATFEQAAYNYLISVQGKCAPLPDAYSFNYTDEEVSATHFAIKILFFQNIHRLVGPLSKN